MKLQEIEQEALALTEPERAELVISLMDTFTALKPALLTRKRLDVTRSWKTEQLHQ